MNYVRSSIWSAMTLLSVLAGGPACAAPPAIKAPMADFGRCSKPEYPKESLRANAQGVVSMSLLVSNEGKVIASKLLKSSGAPLLDAAAMDALALCPFFPATQDGKPVETWVIIHYEWSLES